MKRIITTLAAALIATAAVSAQGLETAYYLDGYTFGYRLTMTWPILIISFLSRTVRL